MAATARELREEHSVEDRPVQEAIPQRLKPAMERKFNVGVKAPSPGE